MKNKKIQNKIKKIRLTLRNPLFIIFFSGVLLNLSFFIRSVFTDMLAFFVIAPVFIALNKLENKKRYLAGLLFFGAWLIPTSYWYFNFMTWWVAILSMTFFTLIANVFQISNLLKKKSIFIDFSIIIFSWVFLTFLRINLPILKNWWIPHIAYTQWQNLIILQLASFSSIFGIIFLILLVNATIAYLWIKGKKFFLLIFSVCLILFIIFGNLYIANISSSKYEDYNFISIQSSPGVGFYTNANSIDVENLKKLTKNALSQINDLEKKTFVLWPENMIEENNTKQLKDFSEENNIYLVFNREERVNDGIYNTVVIIDNNGDEILKNYKSHSAPNENIKTKPSINSKVEVDELKITAAICYELHFFDIYKKAKENDILFAPVDDDRFGKFMPYLHASDIIFRAIENRIDIISASTNGPTMFVNKYGKIENGPLEIYEENYLIIETKKNEILKKLSKSL